VSPSLRDATILRAYVQFEVDAASTAATALLVHGQATGNAATFTTTRRDISSRPRTAASVTWSPAPWTTKQERGTDQRTPDLSTIVTEIVGRTDWASGNALALLITGTGRRTAESFDGTAAPVLHLEYTVAGSGTTTTSSSTTTTTTGTTTTMPQGSDTGSGNMSFKCKFSHRRAADPIVSYGVYPSDHSHDFVGNTSVNEWSTYQSMIRAGTTCVVDGDTAGYWQPTLVAPDGSPAPVYTSVIYYRNRPEEYSRTVAFPPDFRMIAGGPNGFPAVYWTCEGESDGAYSTSKSFVPTCSKKKRIISHVYFPSCWDGVHLDTPDHRSHVTYGFADGMVEVRFPETCPVSHAVKIPQIDFRIVYSVSNGSGYRFSNGDTLPHADFWNTWDQEQLEKWLDECLRIGVHCNASGTR
jgi:hypothetical protein